MARIIKAIILTAAIITATTIIANIILEDASEISPNFERYTVQEGDTLWNIASKAYEDVDLNEAVFYIEEANEVTPQTLTPGMVLEMPNL